MWRGPEEDSAAQRRWEQIRLPVLGILGAARAPLTVAEIAAFAAIPSPETARTFVEETIRAFLSRRGSPAEPPRYALRHQSLRDLLTGNVPARPDLQAAAQMLSSRIQAAHRQITTGLTPPGRPGERDWSSASAYLHQHLAEHAAYCGALDDLAQDPGFLLVTDPSAFLARRESLRVPEAKRALAAFELSLDSWKSSSDAERLASLAANAARVHAEALVAACADRSGEEWPIRWAAWSGQGHRKLKGHNGPVRATAIGSGGGRDLIVTASRDGTARIWDAVTGQPVGEPLTSINGSVTAVGIGHAAGGAPVPAVELRVVPCVPARGWSPRSGRRIRPSTRRALSALLHRSARRQGGLPRPRRADLCRAIQQLDHHQYRRRPDRRQAGGHPGDATRSRPGQQLPQYPGQRHRGRVRRMERPGCSIPDAAETAPVRDPLLHPRSPRSSDRSEADHGPRGGLVARSLAIEYARRGVRVNAEITGEIPHIDGGQSPGTEIPTSHFRQSH